ncbi:hypothetical protein DFP73DRAFT_543372 [Morchella snyderi]|nr:hypothetical protein DFP73DRAFT_543372 [Morchella snyderi]
MQALAQLQVPNPQSPPNPLSASNLEQHTQKLALERSRSIQSQKTQQTTGQVNPLGSMSPDGSPPTMIPGKFGPEDLKLPIRKKRQREVEPEAIKVKEAPKLLHKCPLVNCGNSVKEFETKEKLEEHQKWHEKERQILVEEERRNKHKIENPLGYLLSSAREALCLDSDGNPKGRPDETMKDDMPAKAVSTPQIKPGSTPLLSTTPINRGSGLTPAPARSPAALKTPQLSNAKTPGGKPTPNSKSQLREENANEQLPTPPSTNAWESSSMSPDVIRQCFEGVREGVLYLSTMNPAIVTPAYTPGSSGPENFEGVIESMGGSLEDWNHFGDGGNMVDDLLQEVEWDNDPSFSSLDSGGRNWAMAFGFELKV